MTTFFIMNPFIPLNEYFPSLYRSPFSKIEKYEVSFLEMSLNLLHSLTVESILKNSALSRPFLPKKCSSNHFDLS